jgi:hypothetical protein
MESRWRITILPLLDWQNGGIYVVTLEDAIEQQACENWEAQSEGPPPEEWDCPGY